MKPTRGNNSLAGCSTFGQSIEVVRSLDAALLPSLVDGLLESRFRGDHEHFHSFAFEKLLQEVLFAERAVFVAVDVVWK